MPERIIKMDHTKISILIKKSSLTFDKLSNQLLTPYSLTGSQFKILILLYSTTRRRAACARPILRKNSR